MSDTEKTDASPQKEEVKVEEKSDMVEEKHKEEEEEEQKEEEMEQEKEVGEEDEKAEETKVEPKMEEDEPDTKAEAVEFSPKKSPKKRKKVEKKEEEEEEELPLGLLERPVVIESGKREKRKVERLSMTMTFNPQQKKKVDVPEGTGAKLGECPRIEYKISHMKADDLKSLHRILYGKKGTQLEVKRNIKQFCGFTFTKEDKEYKSRLTSIGKLTLPVLKSWCDVLDLEKSGVKEEVVQRVMEFLMHPVDSGRKVPEPKKRGRASKGDKKEKGVKRKRAEKKEGKRKKKKTSKEDVESDDDDEDDEEEEDFEENDKDDEADEDGDVDDEESEEEVPKKKKTKTEPTKKSKKDSEEKKEKKENDKKEKKEKPAKKAEKKEPKKKKVEVSSDEEDEEDDSDSDTLASKKSGPPNNDELRDVVKKILDGANLEEVTMKTVVKQVYAKYPDFDLTDKKEFIKNTVKQLIS